MQAVHPRITRQTTMWKAWVGFNATHSMGAMLFGWVYGYLALEQPHVLFGSAFLMLTGVVVLAAYAAVSRAYFFSVPLKGILASFVLYAAGAVAGVI